MIYKDVNYVVKFQSINIQKEGMQLGQLLNTSIIICRLFETKPVSNTVARRIESQ